MPDPLIFPPSVTRKRILSMCYKDIAYVWCESKSNWKILYLFAFLLFFVLRNLFFSILYYLFVIFSFLMEYFHANLSTSAEDFKQRLTLSLLVQNAVWHSILNKQRNGT